VLATAMELVKTRLPLAMADSGSREVDSGWGCHQHPHKNNNTNKQAALKCRTPNEHRRLQKTATSEKSATKAFFKLFSQFFVFFFFPAGPYLNEYG